MDLKTDEEEHSIEMHLPYIAKVMNEYAIFKLNQNILFAISNVLRSERKNAFFGNLFLANAYSLYYNYM